ATLERIVDVLRWRCGILQEAVEVTPNLSRVENSCERLRQPACELLSVRQIAKLSWSQSYNVLASCPPGIPSGPFMAGSLFQFDSPTACHCGVESPEPGEASSRMLAWPPL